jgi:hypothetical protein
MLSVKGVSTSVNALLQIWEVCQEQKGREVSAAW